MCSLSISFVLATAKPSSRQLCLRKILQAIKYSSARQTSKLSQHVWSCCHWCTNIPPSFLVVSFTHTSVSKTKIIPATCNGCIFQKHGSYQSWPPTAFLVLPTSNPNKTSSTFLETIGSKAHVQSPSLLFFKMEAYVPKKLHVSQYVAVLWRYLHYPKKRYIGCMPSSLLFSQTRDIRYIVYLKS